jgi:hypothetical protein
MTETNERLLLGNLATKDVRTLTIRIFKRWIDDEANCDSFEMKGTDFRFAKRNGSTEVTAVNPTSDSPVMLVFRSTMHDYRID